VLTDIAVALAESGQLDRALEVAETIDVPDVRLQALAAIRAVKRGEGNQEAAAK
jgi:hypothetical protein